MTLYNIYKTSMFCLKARSPQLELSMQSVTVAMYVLYSCVRSKISNLSESNSWTNLLINVDYGLMCLLMFHFTLQMTDSPFQTL